MAKSALLATSVALLIWADCRAQTGPPARSSPSPLERALQLARSHRYAEAAQAIKGVPPPGGREQQIAFYRLKASIESGLGHSRAAAVDMEAAAHLAPGNVELQIASCIARLQVQLETHQNPAATLDLLRGFSLPAEQRLEIGLRTGEMLSRAELFAEAAKEFELASRLAPERADILFNLALAHFRNGDWEQATASAEQAKSLEESGALESLLGDLQERRGDALSAVRSYQAAVRLEPEREEYRLALARELLRHQTFDAAVVVLEQAAELFPQSARTKILLGLSYFLVDRSPDSVRMLLAAARLDPDQEIAQRYLGEITLQDSARPDRGALDEICGHARSRPSNGSASAYCGGGLLRLSEEEGDRSRQPEILRWLGQAVRNSPGEPLARCQLGKALEWSQQWQHARIELEKCAQLDPDSPEGHYRLARVYRHLGLNSLASQQSLLQQKAAERQTEESTKRSREVSRFLVLLEH